MEQYKDFGDVSDGYWAAEYIKAAAKSGWINGYEDGSFRADRNISRAEVVTIVNRLLDREADESYIADSLRKLNMPMSSSRAKAPMTRRIGQGMKRCWQNWNRISSTKAVLNFPERDRS